MKHSMRLNRKSIAARHRQSWEDFVNHRLSSPEPGGYPVNPNGEEAYAAGLRRGFYAAYRSALRKGQRPETNEDDTSTAAGQGELDGWNAAVAKLS